MKSLYHRIKSLLALFGFNPTVCINFLRGFPRYLKDLYKFKKLREQMSDDFQDFRYHIVLGDWYIPNGSASGQYFHQDMLVASKIFRSNPVKHVDIGSRVDGFVAHIAVFREIEVFDVRPQKKKVNNIVFKQADLMHLPDGMKNYCDSLSSLHTIEHFGLGRYGDPLDPNGHLKGLDTIYEILKPGGMFYFSVPIGKQRIEFNGHRIFDVAYLLKVLTPKYKVINFAFVDDAGDLHDNVMLESPDLLKNYGCWNGCGIFELQKIK